MDEENQQEPAKKAIKKIIKHKTTITTSNASIVSYANAADIIVCLRSHLTCTPCTMSKTTSHTVQHHHPFSMAVIVKNISTQKGLHEQQNA